jgi:hypothetical protein
LRREELNLTKVAAAWLATGPSTGDIFVPFLPKLAGLPSQNGQDGHEPGSVAVRPLSTQWLSDERIAEARRVWSKAYGRVIGEDEAVEILMNVRRLAEVLLRAEEGNEP